MKISYGITCCNEVKEINELLGKLYRYLADVEYDYEFVILQDGNDISMTQTLTEWARQDVRVRHYMHDLDNNFGEHKNALNRLCHGDYIFQIDADEYPSSVLVNQLGTLLEMNEGVDLVWTPRVNTVSGLTTDHIVQWGWKVTQLEDVELMVVNWPDYQSRIYRNHPSIHWVNKVHEHVEGVDKYTILPQETIWALFHPKTIEKQEQQNAKYITMQR